MKDEVKVENNILYVAQNIAEQMNRALLFQF